MKKNILYIDMDGVIVDFQSGIDGFKKLHANNPLMIDNVASWEGRWDENPVLFGLMKPMPGAVEAFKKLSQQFDTYVLSTAPWKNPPAWEAKREWVEKYLGNAAHKRLILSHHKHLMRGHYLIDDRRGNGADSFEGTHIHFGTQRFPDWKAVMEYMNEVSFIVNEQ